MLPDSEPVLDTDPSISQILAELTAYEPIFHHPEKGKTRADLERLTADDFWEIGASGRRYSRAYVLALVEERFAANQSEEQVLEASDFHCRRLCEHVYLLTYNLVQNGVRKTRRTTIWRRSHVGWQIVFHQGTIVQDEAETPVTS